MKNREQESYVFITLFSGRCTTFTSLTKPAKILGPNHFAELIWHVFTFLQNRIEPYVCAQDHEASTWHCKL